MCHYGVPMQEAVAKMLTQAHGLNYLIPFAYFYFHLKGEKSLQLFLLETNIHMQIHSPTSDLYTPRMLCILEEYLLLYSEYLIRATVSQISRHFNAR